MRRFFTLFLLLLSYNILIAQIFTEVSAEAGINHAFRVDLANFGGGAAVIDFDNDGFEDLYITGGNEPDVFYKNNGDGTFTNIISQAGFESTIPWHTQGVAAADINRDGFKDILVTTLYDKNRDLTPNLLFLNNGDGTFRDVTRQYGLDKYASNSQGASFGDINADGYPDLYVSNYIAGSPKGVSIFNERTITENYASAEDFLFINAGGQFFIEVSKIYGLDHDGFGFEGKFTDWDNDGDVDLLIANDFGFKARPNVALRNDFPEKKMTYKGNSLRLNFGMNAMGIAAGDYNFDGWMDYFVTNINVSLFSVNQQGKSFANSAPQAGLALPLIDKPDYRGVPVSWGANFFDFDHDTDLDLFVNNGALNPLTRPNHNFFFEFRAGRYFEIGAEAGVDDPRIGRGSVTFDYDNDGDLDLLAVNQHPRDPSQTLPPARCLLYRNDGSSGNWLKVKLEGVNAEMDGIGSRVEVKLSDRTMIREIDGGSSHLSQSSTIAHFGLAENEVVESVTVKWLGGKTQEIKNVAANQQITITETDESIFSFNNNSLLVYPGFFTDNIIIEYELEEEGPIDISVYDVQGRLIENLTRQDRPAKTGIWQWNINRDLVRGVYLFQLRTKNSVIARRAVKL